MAKYEVVTPFKGSPDGVRVISYDKGDIVPNDEKPFPDSLAEVAVAEKWVKPAKVKKAAAPAPAGEKEEA
jgi:hypothetical protein